MVTLVNIATIAAFVAAGTSLVNVAFSARLTRRGELDKWRRDTEAANVVQMQMLSRSACKAWDEAAHEKVVSDIDHQNMATDAWRRGSEILGELRTELARLDLISSNAVRQAAEALVREHEGMCHHLRPASGVGDDPRDLFLKHDGEISELECGLIVQARFDLKVDRRLRLPRKKVTWKSH